MGWEEKLDKARRRHRPSLQDWTCDGFYQAFPSYVRSIETKHSQYESFTPHQQEQQHDTGTSSHASSCCCRGAGINYHPEIPIVADAITLSQQQFIDQIESKSIPAAIRQIPTQDSPAAPWVALHKWTLEALRNDKELCNRYFKCGEDDNGKSIKVKLKYFLQYLHHNQDDSPLYIFDSNFDEDRVSKKLLSHYHVPSYFNEDLFHLVGERRRPPYRWFLVGPERSGTTVHVDPLGTSAWNTLLVGKKRWILFPPDVPKSVVKGRGLISRKEDDEPVHYFTTIFPRMKEKSSEMARRRAVEPYSTDSELRNWKNFKCYEFTQMAGETVFIPNGWWHAVLNLTHTVAVTQNFCSSRNFDSVWLETRSGRKRMAWKWLCQLSEQYPHLAKRARVLNQDGFVMKYDPGEVQRRNEEEEPKRQKKEEEKAKHRRKKEDGRKKHRKHDRSKDEQEICSKSDKGMEGEQQQHDQMQHQQKFKDIEYDIKDAPTSNKLSTTSQQTHTKCNLEQHDERDVKRSRIVSPLPDEKRPSNKGKCK